MVAGPSLTTQMFPWPAVYKRLKAGEPRVLDLGSSLTVVDREGTGPRQSQRMQTEPRQAQTQQTPLQPAAGTTTSPLNSSNLASTSGASGASPRLIAGASTSAPPASAAQLTPADAATRGSTSVERDRRQTSSGAADCARTPPRE